MVSYVGVSNAAGENSGTTTTASTVAITPTLPAGAAAGDRILVFQAASATSGTTPTNWNVVGTKDTVLGSGAVAAAGGLRYGTWYWRDYDGVWSMPSFSLTSAAQNSHWIGAVAIRPTSGHAFSTPTITTVGGAFNTAGTSYTDTSAAAFNTFNGAFLLIGTALNDLVTASAQALTQSGATFGTVTERADGGTATGNDVAGNIATCSVTAGTHLSGATATTFTATLSAASQGETLIVQQTEAVKAATFTDDFTTFDTTTKWTGTASISSGKLAVTAGVNATTVVISKSFYDLTSSSAYIELSNYVGATGQYFHDTWFMLTADDTDNNYFTFLVESYNGDGGYVYFRERANAVNSETSIPYDPVAHKYLRIRHDTTAGGTVYWDTSPDGTTWTNRRSKAPAVNCTWLQLWLRVQSLNSAVASPGTINNFDNLNTAPTAVQPPLMVQTDWVAMQRANLW